MEVGEPTIISTHTRATKEDMAPKEITVSYTPNDYMNLKKLVAKATKDGKAEFVYKGTQYHTKYAKYLVLHLEQAFVRNPYKS